MTNKDSLGDRMKAYENVPRSYLIPRMPVLIRIDGNSFSKFTKKFKKPWDNRIQDAMTHTTKFLIKNISGCEIGYIQSDEISLLLNTYKRFNTQPWFGNNIQKICSVSASMAAAAFNEYLNSLSVNSEFPSHRKLAYFDARCWNIPENDVVNYFWWRQEDAIRNSVSVLAQSQFSPKELHGKSQITLKRMLTNLPEKIDWDIDVSVKNQRGWCVVKEQCLNDEQKIRIIMKEDLNIPIFKEDRDYIRKFLTQLEK